MRSVRTGMAVLLLALLAGNAHGGSGTIDFTTDRINLTFNLRFPPTPAQLDTLRTRITTMSHTLWDATEGQLRVGTVTISCTAANLDIADYWLAAEPIRSNAPIGLNAGVLGSHVNQFFGNSGGVFAHEFGHYGFSLGDEYGEDRTTCGSKSKGPCFDAGASDAQNQCLMQQIGGLDWSELCVSSNHEALKGNNAACLLNPPDPTGAPAPCSGGRCAAWNTTTLRMESSQQERINAQSCWQTLDANFPDFTPPAGLPVVAEPAGFTDPTFTVTCGGATRLMLVLDRSGSMAWSVKSDSGEVCANGIDDDADGSIDEADDCADPRMKFVRAAGRSILDLASDASVRAGIVSFDTTAATTEPLQELAANLGTLKTSIDGLSPGSLTAIGDALTHAKGLIDAEPGTADSKAAILITDGHNTAGSSPATAAAAYVTAGIRLYAIATGEASNSATINDVTANTNGYAVNEPTTTDVVTAMAELYAQYTNTGVVIPQTPYAIHVQGRRDTLPLQPRAGNLPKFATNDPGLPRENVISFPIEQGTQKFTALLAGNLADMRGFGIEAILRAPGGATISSAAPPAGVHLVLDEFYTLMRIPNPTPGTWQLVIRGRAGAAPAQTGTLVVLADNPRTHLFADLDRHVVRAAGETVRLDLNASYVSGLSGVDFDVTVLRPDGSLASVPVTEDPESPGRYAAILSSFPFRGSYELRIDMRTTPGTVNDPGEEVPGEPRPPLTVSVPLLARSITRRFFVDIGQWPCNAQDCDNDGIVGEPAVDRDNDGVPAPNDPDDDNNEVPDNRQPGLGGRGGDDPQWPTGRERAWWFGGAVGSAHPLGRLNGIADANIYGKLDLMRTFGPSLAARLALGFAQFTAQPALTIDHPYYGHLSLNAQFLAPFGAGSRLFVNGGPGFYRDEGGSTSAGGNVGAGVQLDIMATSRIELGADYHFVNDDRGRFLAWHLGILFRR